ncbi:hypothetical protein GE115_02560 [Agromyces sp. CFH 90414]|uniref:Uncharacterized protein n=1 Tax=Agromyces agglutinans TaxID=2662258 RepID=A0A6I2F2E4_9MICO|nr:hypothetical protein [Agromyces agglutinans]MRG58759.1 hypothetical protein [Agromyces agglutinans]
MVEVKFSLSRSEALVLFDWLSRFNETGDPAFADQAEERVLWDIEAFLERQLPEPFDPDYERLLATAREAVRDSTA